MTRFYEPDLGTDPDNPFARDATKKLVRRSYWLDMNDRSQKWSHFLRQRAKRPLADMV